MLSRRLVRACILVTTALWATLGGLACASVLSPKGLTVRPNVLLIYADDLGYGELGCYGQTKIATPNLDALAAAGRRYTRAYTGAPVCAPARCMLLTGRAPLAAQIRDNVEVQPEGQKPLAADTPNLARSLRAAGYATALYGKWGLGPVGSSGDPNAQGFEQFYGYACQRHAHSHTPAWLWRNQTREPLAPGTYAPDRFRDEALEFVRTRGERPFFLMYATTIPHMAMQVPEDSLAEYAGRYGETPYTGGRGYTPHPTPRAAYAAMITRLDRDVGVLLDELRRRGELERTVVVFTSDNGPTHDVGGVDTEFFASAGGLRGRKGSLYEGGVRVPLLVAGPTWGLSDGPSVSDRHIANWDLANTLLDLCGQPRLPGEGESFAPSLRGEPQEPRSPIVWDFPGYGGQQAVLMGEWKALRRGLAKTPDAPWELYHLPTDPTEQTDLSAQHPDLIAEASRLGPDTPRQGHDTGND